MFSPNKWIKPRLKSFCVAFGVADVTLVLLSAIGWYFFFEIGFQAQQNHMLAEFRIKGPKIATTTEFPKKFPIKEDQTEEKRRYQRTVRACGLAHEGIDNDLEQNFATPGALIGASMGGFAILGVLLAGLGLLGNPRGRKIICTISATGECLCSLFLLIAVAMLFANESLCPTEYYFEAFQPLFQTFIYVIIFIASYKTYEITVILFYLVQQSKLAKREVEINNSLRRSVHLPPADVSVVNVTEYLDDSNNNR